MPMKAIEFYEQFQCMGETCPFTCCMGWGIGIDDATFDRYQKERGILGCRLRAFSYRDKEQGPLIRRVRGACPFHTMEQLCYFQKNGRMDLMPEVCRLFPRRSVMYGREGEVTLELSCIRAAELFLEHMGRLEFVECKENLPVFWEIDHVDGAFYQFMLKQRGKILDYLWGDADFAGKVHKIYEYVYAANQWLAKDRMDRVEILSLPLCREEKEEGMVKPISKDVESYAFFPVTFLNRMIYGNVLRDTKEKNNPVLDRLLKLYDNYWGKVTEQQADAHYQEQMQKMLKAQPKLLQVFQAYFSYLLQQTFCLACEDYYLLKPVLLSILQTEFVMLFCLLEFMAGEALTKQTLAKILVCEEKALRHSVSLNEKIMAQVREQFFK